MNNMNRIWLKINYAAQGLPGIPVVNLVEKYVKMGEIIG